jgi:hypothetical protein
MINVIRRLLGKPVKLSPKQEAKMARIYARADEQVAQREAAGRKAQEEYAAFMASQGLEVPQAPQVAPPTNLRDVGTLFKHSFEGFKDAVGEGFDDRRDVLDPGDAQLNKPVPEVEDPSERARIATAERAERDRARAPFVAPDAPPITFTRFATTGRTQLEDVVGALRASGLAAHPERVFGVYRVPDRFDHNRNQEAGAYLEWEIAHAPGALGPATDEILMTGFKRDDHWAARTRGQASVLDEDVAGALVSRARVRPEDSYGLHRLLNARWSSDAEGGQSWNARIEGVLLFTRPLAAIPAAQAELTAQAPLALAEPLPYHVEILDWEAVAAWVSPHRYGPQRVPSPLPHLPSTWQELLEAYLQVVGVRSEDCYGVQVTRSADRSIADLSMASFSKNLSGKEKYPCVDGTARAVMHLAEHVVLAYRDGAGYEAGRARWRAYQQEVLHARLDHLTGVRPPIEVGEHRPPSLIGEVFEMFDPFGQPSFPQIFNRNARPSLGPYCGELED